VADKARDHNGVQQGRRGKSIPCYGKKMKQSLTEGKQDVWQVLGNKERTESQK